MSAPVDRHDGVSPVVHGVSGRSGKLHAELAIINIIPLISSMNQTDGEFSRQLPISCATVLSVRNAGAACVRLMIG